jgi:hypothetical protein
MNAGNLFNPPCNVCIYFEGVCRIGNEEVMYTTVYLPTVPKDECMNE